MYCTVVAGFRVGYVVGSFSRLLSELSFSRVTVADGRGRTLVAETEPSTGRRNIVVGVAGRTRTQAPQHSTVGARPLVLTRRHEESL